MKKILFAAVCAVSAFAATPALAEDGGEGRAEARGGVIFIADDEFAVGGLAAGYDWDLGGAFAGFEVSADKIFEEDAGFLLSAAGRVGTQLGEKTKVYAVGGYTWLTCNGCPDGWTAGAGVQHKLGEKVYLKAEYRHAFIENSPIDGDVVVAGVGFAL